MPRIPLHQNLADLPPSIKHRYLEYHYTKFSSSTSRSTPPINQAYMPWIPLHQTWQIYWQIYPTHQSSIDALNTITPNLAALPADLPTHQSSIDALNTITPNLADLLADLPPHQSSIDALNIITPNLADLLADLPHPSIKHRCLEYHYTKTWQIYPPSVKHRCLEYHYTKLGRSTGRSTPPINQA